MDLDSAVWIDVNTNLALNGYPDRLPDELGIQLSSFYNLLKCPIGGMGRTFQPEYGTVLYHLLQEPINERIADRIKIGFIQAIARWEPRIVIDFHQTFIVPDMNIPGYRIRLTINLRLTDETFAVEFTLNQR